MNPPATVVVAGVIQNLAGEVLITQRSQPAQFAGQWEFPGGKVDPGETLHHALVRELKEELDIEIQPSAPLISITHHYPHATVRLNVRTVSRYEGTPKGAEGQAIQWVRPDDLPEVNFLEANTPIINAVRLPAYYVITDTRRYGEKHTLERLETLLEQKKCIVQVREKAMGEGEFRRFSKRAIELCHEYRTHVVANTHPDIALELGYGGVHLSSDKLMDFESRPVPDTVWLGASCHDPEELESARRIGADFAVLGPVASTTSHPGAREMGWARFSEISTPAKFPVYALGGMGFDDVVCARDHGAQGVATISAAWE